MEDILGLVCLMVYADEPEIRVRCRMLIDLLAFDLAVNGFQGHLPTTHGRVYTRFIIEPDYEDCSAVMRFLFDEETKEAGMSNCAVMLAACGYGMPGRRQSGLSQCQQDPDKPGAHEHRCGRRQVLRRRSGGL